MSNEKIAIFTHLDNNFKSIDDVVKDNHLAYSRENNHEYIKLSTDQIINHEPVNKEIYWVKIMGALNILSTRQDIDWLFMVDLDVVFNKMKIPLSFFTNCANKQHEILMCSMGNNMPRDYWNVNIGAMFFKNTNRVRKFLQSFLELGINNQFLYFEQVMLHYTLQNNGMLILDNVGFFPENSFNHGNNNTFLYHACGASTSSEKFDVAIQQKKDILQRVLDLNNE